MRKWTNFMQRHWRRSDRNGWIRQQCTHTKEPKATKNDSAESLNTKTPPNSMVDNLASGHYPQLKIAKEKWVNKYLRYMQIPCNMAMFGVE